MNIDNYEASYEAYMESYDRMNPRRFPWQNSPTRIDVSVRHNEGICSEGYIILNI